MFIDQQMTGARTLNYIARLMEYVYGDPYHFMDPKSTKLILDSHIRVYGFSGDWLVETLAIGQS